MKTLPIITDLNVPRNVIPRFLPRRVGCTMNALNLHRSVERLGQRIIETYASAADRLTYPEPFQDRRELSGSIVAPAVGVKHRAGRETEITGSHLDGLGNQRGLIVVSHGPAGYLTRGKVNYRSEIEPSFPGRDVSDITNHFLARGSRAEITVHQVGDRHGGGWQATRPSSRIRARTSSSPAATPQRASCEAIRR